MNRLDKQIFTTLFFSLFAAVTGVGIVIPLLPIYANNLGASGFYISMIFGAFSISRTAFLPFFGRLSDRKGRKPFIVIGLFLYSVVSVGLALTSSVEGLIVVRFFQGIASAMIMPVAQAYIGDITPKGREGFYMGLFNVSMFMSMSIGPFLGGMLSEQFSLQSAFIAMGILALIAFTASYLFLPKVEFEPSPLSRQDDIISWKQMASDIKIFGLCIYRFVYTASIGVIWCFLPIYSDSKFGLSGYEIGILVTTGVFVSGFLHTPVGWLADKLNRVVMVVTGGVIVAFSLYTLLWARGFWDILVSVSLFGLGGGISMPAMMAIAVVKGKKIGAAGSVMGLLTMAHSLGMLAGSLLAGLTMDYIDLVYAFPMGSVVMITGVVSFVCCFAVPVNKDAVS